MMRLRGSGDIKVAVAEHLASRGDLAGRCVVDLPAGSGASSRRLREAGAIVEPYDLFPEAFAVEGLECRHADLRERLPIDDGHAQLVLCQEALEHMPDPLHALRELNRILVPGGTLLVTTPNVSNLRARLSHMLVESELYNRLPPTEIDAVWSTGGRRVYFGHLFLIGAQRLRTLAALAGFCLARVHPVKLSTMSLLLGVLYPALAAATAFAWWRTRRRNAATDPARRDQALAEVVRLNLHPAVLFGKHLFFEFVKTGDWNRVGSPVTKDPRTIR